MSINHDHHNVVDIIFYSTCDASQELFIGRIGPQCDLLATVEEILLSLIGCAVCMCSIIIKETIQ